MDRRLFVKGVGFSALGTQMNLARSQADSASGSRQAVVGIVTFRGATDVENGFKSFLTQAGINPRYVEHDIARDRGKIPAIVENLKQQKADVVLTWGTSVTKEITGSVTAPMTLPCPVVFALVTAPIPSGIVESLNGSKRDITGVYHVATVEQQIQAIEQYRLLSAGQKLGVLYTPTENNSIVTLELLQKYLQKQGIEVLGQPVNLTTEGKPTADGIESLVDSLASRGAQWLYLPPDSFVGSQAKARVIPAAHAAGLPTFATTEQLMDSGALLGLVCSYFEIGQFAGFKAAQVLKGATAGSLPVETLQTYSLRINPQVAKDLKLTPPLKLFGVAKFQAT